MAADIATDITQVIVVARKGAGSFKDRLKFLFQKNQPIFGVLVGKDNMPSDPITAIFAFLTLALQSPTGLLLIKPLVEVEGLIGTALGDLITSVQAQIKAKNATPVATTPTTH
jgi:hypothetical protein